jgi:hypothetical protein
MAANDSHDYTPGYVRMLTIFLTYTQRLWVRYDAVERGIETKAGSREQVEKTGYQDGNRTHKRKAGTSSGY